MSKNLTPAKAKAELKTMTKKMERYSSKLTSIQDLIGDLADPAKLIEFKVRTANIDLTYSQFESCLDRILELNSMVEDEADQVNDGVQLLEAFEKLYYQIRAAQSTYVPAEVRPPNAPNEPLPTKPKLPAIQIKPFDGTFEHFATFQSLYEALVHSQPLSVIEKYSYLRSLLTGSALNCIQGFAFVEAQYEAAYHALCTRYTNKRVVATSICNKLFAFKPLSSDSQLSLFLDNFNVHVESFKSVNVLNQGDFILSFMALRLLDPVTRQAFEDSRVGNLNIPTYRDVLKFVQGRVAVAEMLPPPIKSAAPRVTHKPVPPPPLKRNTFMTNVSPSPPNKPPPGISCPLCQKAHRIIECNQFQALTIARRYDTLREKHLCFSCLGPHSKSECHSKFACRHCGSKQHHSLLHNTPATDVPSTSNKTSASLSGSAIPIQPGLTHQVLLGTAIVKINDVFGKSHNIRVLIDPGSMISIITQSLSDRLCLPARPSGVQVSGIGSSQPQQAQGSVTCTVKSNHKDFSMEVEAAILPRIASLIPSMPVPQGVIDRFKSVQLADPTFHTPQPVQMLIGAQHYAEIMQTTEPVVPGKPALVPSALGTLVLGEAPSLPSSGVQSSSYHTFFISNSENDLSTQLRKFWEMEEMQVKIPVDPEDAQYESHFVDTHTRDSNGVYVVRLPFREGKAPELGNNISCATDRLLKLERRLDKQPNFKELYHANLQDYIDSGHMVLSDNPSSYVLTHHGVTKDSSTTKVRVVFNPAEKSSPMHPSLNESLLVGPKLQNNINDILLNFRLHRVALTADIKQMYRAIKVDPRDSKYQQILWRFDSTEPIQVYEITRVCFGVSSSPYQALRVIKQLIKDEGDAFPVAAQVLDTDVYIDDVCTGASSLTEALQLRDDLTALLSTAGFELRKWSSSNPAILEDLSMDLREKPHKFGDHETIQVLGIQWDSHEDVFCYQVLPVSECTTKRQVLSQIARMYDLPGFLSPVIIWMKIMLQRIWLAGLGWDATLPSEMIDQWNKFVSEMPCLSDIKIPRYILDTYVYPPELIGFSDASSTAMACLVYLRVVCSDQRVLVNLIRAKTKVAPVKPVTIPRLELTASFMLATLIESLQPLCARLQIETIRLYTDSMVVLSWLRTPPHLLKVFVANRVVKILDVTLPTQWFHIPTAENPADIASRGCFPSHLVTNNLWWHGPTFLLQDPSSWPQCEQHVPVSDVPELKSPPVLTANVVLDNGGVSIIERFSSFTRAQRVLAWILRFKRNCLSSPENRLSGPLKVSELDEAENTMIKITQSFYLANVLNCIVNKAKLPISIQQLSPFISQGFLRVGGRIDKAPLPYDSRHPYLLPAKCHLAILLVKYYHASSLHGGPRIVQHLVQSKYFILGLRNLTRKVIFQCVQCYRFNAKPRQPYMAELPMSRFEQGRPFIHVGVDLAGPFALKDGSRRNSPITKGYFAIFVCFAVKAVHLEALTSLTSECFLACLDRFVARRGLPKSLFSDQGTNFKGAARHLDETFEFLKSSGDQICDHLAKQSIEWSFNCPANPSAGGLWEAGVKSVKSHLKHLLNDRPLRLEEFTTILCRIEAILNSRPLGVPSSLPTDGVECLTPGHFLVGGPLLSRPELNFVETPDNRLPRWELLSKVIQQFWRRWCREYLHTLIQRQRWLSPSDNPKVGDIVLVTSETTSPMNWPLARVTDVFPGDDQVVRIVSVRTATGTLNRPVRKLLILPFCA